MHTPYRMKRCTSDIYRLQRQKMIIYNILSKEKAQNTLERLTGITWSEWKAIRDGYDRARWSYEDDYIEDVLKEKM